MSGVTCDPRDPRLTHGADEASVDQAEVYLVNCEESPFVRPVRRSYVHTIELGGCGAVTTMGVSLAETYAKTPHFYGATYCVGCQMHRRVGVNGEFHWDGTTELVGT